MAIRIQLNDNSVNDERIIVNNEVQQADPASLKSILYPSSIFIDAYQYPLSQEPISPNLTHMKGALKSVTARQEVASL